MAAAAAFIIGFLFHGPLFGKLWMKLANIHPTGNEKFSDMYGKMAWNFIVNLITAYGLAIVYAFAAATGYLSGSIALNGVLCAILVWLGFISTATSIEVIWMGKSFKLWLFEAVSSLVVMVSMGLIIALWQ